MPTAEPTLTLTQRKRLAIIAAARREFLESGFRDTSMDRVAERAQVSKRTVYNHFSSKEALFAAIAAQFIQQLQQAIALQYDKHRPLDEQLREIARKEVEMVTSEDYIAVFKVFLAEMSSFPDLFETIIEENSSAHDPVEDWILAAVNDGKLRIDTIKLAAVQFTSLLKGALFWPLIAGYGAPSTHAQREAVIDGAVAMFLDHYQV